MVALRTPGDLGPPPQDGLPTREIPTHSTQKTHYVCRFAETAATATKNIFPGRRAYIDMFAAYGICRDKDTGGLSWGSPLLALQVTTPYDLYILNDINHEATRTLAQRVKNLGIPGAAVLELDLTAPRAMEHARELARVVVPWGPKVIVTTGNANEAPLFVQELLAPWRGRRYVLALIDPQSAIFQWRAFEALAVYERAMDVLTLFPDVMDLSRGLAYYLNNPKAGAKLDAYFACEWRNIARARPQHAEHELRALYERRMGSILDFKIGHPKGVGLSRRPLYHLIFGSKSQFGINLWNDVNRRTPWEQDELFLDGA